ncbi:MAG: DNA cytosine methyltransferase [Butyrivibrio sp.]|nr:DNA cytosine methyltransferase [Butyrivibrio sp.]
MGKYTITDICNETGLTRYQVLCHINGQTLKAKKISGSYEIDDDTYNLWKKNIPDLHNVEKKSTFGEFEKGKYKDNNGDLFEEKTVEENVLNINQIIQGIDVDINSKFTFADFFSGAGGISCGFAAAGYRPVVFIDNFVDATKTYRNYFEKILGFNLNQKKDVLDITKKEIKKNVIDLLKLNHPYVICGGFPCQGFSLSGTSIATDARNTLYYDMLEIVNEIKPEYIVMENVVGILSMLNGNVVRKILFDYEKIGYKITWKILDAADYGVPQHRKRVIFIGNRIGYKNVFPKAFRNEITYSTVREAIARYENMPESKQINHIMSKHSDDMKKRLMNVEIGKQLYEKYNDSWKKCSPDKPSCTIKENHGATNIHYSLPRVITPREMAALQSFPENFFFIGNKSQQIKQIGNAVPPILAQAIAIALKDNIGKIINE